MKILNLLAVALFLGMSTFLNAEVVNSNNPVNPPTESFDNDETSLLVVMMDTKKVFVQWESKVKGVYFEIERSIDGENYETIATSENIEATSEDLETSSDGMIFQFVDDSPATENYYRIFYITPSGIIDYTDVIFVSPLPEEMTIEGLEKE